MIWCVDDDAAIRDLEVYTLCSMGHQARGFTDGKEMFEALETQIPELILLDIMLPGEDGVTEVLIQNLHRMDDNEVTNNVKNGHPMLTAEQKAAKKEWEEAHPGEKYPMDWNLSLNYEFDKCEDGDVSKSSVLSGASYDPFADMDVPDEVLKLREIAANKMTDRQRQAYELIGLEERTITEAAKIMGVSIKVAKVHYDKAIDCIRKNF